MLTLGQSILLWRSHRGLSQQQLAEKARLSRPNLSAIESGKRDVTLGTLRILAAALEVRPGVLADGEAPGERTQRPLTRDLMERLAKAVAHERRHEGGDEQLVSDLALITRDRRDTRSGAPSSRRSGVRAANTAWLRLKARCTPAELESLIRRVDEQARQ